MSLDLLLTILGYTAVTGFAILLLWPFKRANPVFWFLVFQYLMASGTFLLVDFGRESDYVYVLLYFLFLLAFLAGVGVTFNIVPIRKAFRTYWQQPVEVDAMIVRKWVFMLVGLSALVTIIYYMAVGTNFVLLLVQGATLDDYSNLRLKAYSGEQYFAPGYVNQFKNVLLPVGFSMLVLWAFYRGRRRLCWGYLIAGVPFLLYSLLGTGQRAFLVYAFIAFVFGLYLLLGKRETKKFSRRVLLVWGSVVLILFSVFTYYYKKPSLKIDDGLSVVALVMQEVFGRVLVTQQEGGLVGFRYLYEMKRHDPEEWVKEIMGISPWFTYKSVAHEISWVMYGTDRGTVPLSIVGSAYYNGGVVGLLVYAFLMGFSYIYVYYLALRGRRTVYRAMIYGAITFYLALHVSGSPVTLVNNGVVALMLMLLVRKLLARDRPRLRHVDSSVQWN